MGDISFSKKKSSPTSTTPFKKILATYCEREKIPAKGYAVPATTRCQAPCLQLGGCRVQPCQQSRSSYKLSLHTTLREDKLIDSFGSE